MTELRALAKGKGAQARSHRVTEAIRTPIMITLRDIVDSLGLGHTWAGSRPGRDQRVFIRDVEKLPKPPHHSTQWLWPRGDAQIQTVRAALWRNFGDGGPPPPDATGVLAGLPSTPPSPHTAPASPATVSPTTGPPAEREERYPFGLDSDDDEEAGEEEEEEEGEEEEEEEGLVGAEASWAQQPKQALEEAEAEGASGSTSFSSTSSFLPTSSASSSTAGTAPAAAASSAGGGGQKRPPPPPPPPPSGAGPKRPRGRAPNGKVWGLDGWVEKESGGEEGEKEELVVGVGAKVSPRAQESAQELAQGSVRPGCIVEILVPSYKGYRYKVSRLEKVGAGRDYWVMEYVDGPDVEDNVKEDAQVYTKQRNKIRVLRMPGDSRPLSPISRQRDEQVGVGMCVPSAQRARSARGARYRTRTPDRC